MTATELLRWLVAEWHDALRRTGIQLSEDVPW